MSLLSQFEHLRIQLEAIKSATNNFSRDHLIGEGGSGRVYKGELLLPEGRTMVALRRFGSGYAHRDPELWNQVLYFSVYRHENLVSILGFCDDEGERILVYEYISRQRGLDAYLASNDLMWVQCLKICIGAARGLAYLHNPPGTHQRVLHRNFKSSNILLDGNWDAKIADLFLSNVGPTNQNYSFLTTNVVGTIGYCDPMYVETWILTKKSDVYSFGVVLFEVLCGRLCMLFHTRDNHRNLMVLVRNAYKHNNLDEVIFGNIKDEINPTSLNVFATIAFRCVKREPEVRPQMIEILRILETALEYQASPQHLKTLSNQRSLKPLHWEKTPDTGITVPDSETIDLSATNTKSSVMKEFEYLRLPLGFLQEATNNFGKGNFIGKGGFGQVFRAEFLDSEGETTVGAVKRLDRSKDRVDVSFWNEVMLLSTYRHEKIIPLIGFCDDLEERIIVYEYASNKSLDLYLDDRNLTWIQRLKICLGAASGLEYLHNPKGTQQRVLHRDVKSANILLDGNWNAKIADFGLSRYGPANQQHTFVITDAKGTLGYCDPQYIDTMILTKESDVYSFGVVLFEVLCSRLCVDLRYNDLRRSLPKLVNKCYQEQSLDTIIDVNLRNQMDQNSYDTFVSLGYDCLERDPTKRPSMDSVVRKLQVALKHQEGSDVLAKNVSSASSSRPSFTSDDIPNPDNQVDPNDTTQGTETLLS